MKLTAGQRQTFQRILDQHEARLGDAAPADHAAIRRARVRLAEGTFGRCGRCGTGLGFLQLAARPTAEHCADCATAHAGRSLAYATPVRRAS